MLVLLDSRLQLSIATFFFPTVIVAIRARAHQFRQENNSLTNSGQHQPQEPDKISCDDQSTWTFIRQCQMQQSYNDGGNEKTCFLFPSVTIRRGSKFDKIKVVMPDN